jgi:hypothetical protein
MRVIIAATMFAAALASSSAFAQGMGNGDMGKKGGAYCLKTSAGAMDCAYKTMAECDKAKTGGSDTCMKNSGGGMSK